MALEMSLNTNDSPTLTMMLMRFLCCVLAMMGTTAFAADIRPPSDLRVDVLGANSFLLTWKDNSNNEEGWEVLANVGTNSTPIRYTFLPSANLTSYLLISNEIPGRVLRLQVRAYSGSEADRQYSPLTSIVTVTAAAQSVFQAAEHLKATTLDDGRIRIRWDDVSTTESGYLIEFREGNQPWKVLGTTSVEKRYNKIVQNLEPSTSYAFRVKAFKGQGQIATLPSNEASARTLAFQPPTQFKATAEGEGRISLQWSDPSSLEQGFEIQAKAAGKSFQVLGEVGANITSTTPITLRYDTTYEFRIRAFRSVAQQKVFSRFSALARAHSAGLARPSGLQMASAAEQSVTLRWTDESSREEGYTLRYREKGTKRATLVPLPANTRTHTLSSLKVGTAYEVQVRAFDGKTASRYTPVQTATTKDRLTGPFDQSLTADVSFFYEIGVTTPSRVDSISVTNLPAGLVFDAAQRTISGIVQEPGVYEATIRATFTAGYTLRQKLVLRVVAQEGGPLIVSNLPSIQVGKGNTADVSLHGRFRDADVTAARRFTTTMGTFDVVLFESETPASVENFLAYADGGRYDDTFFHRAPTGFVVQGGGFTYDGSAFGKVDLFAPLINEPGISNRTGTVAMAKLPGDPDSATSQFFINLSDENAAILDAQNGGFTVFGRIPDRDMVLFEEIDALPKGSYPIDPGDGSIDLDDVPLRTEAPAPETLDPTQLVRVTSVDSVPVLRWTVTSLTPAIATVSLDGSDVRVTGRSAGTARIQVRATDLDGLYADQIFTVTVP